MGTTPNVAPPYISKRTSTAIISHATNPPPSTSAGVAAPTRRLFGQLHNGGNEEVLESLQTISVVSSTGKRNVSTQSSERI